MQISLFGKKISLTQLFSNDSRQNRLPILYGNDYAHKPEQDKVGTRISARSFYIIHNNNGDVAGCVRELQKWTCKAGHRFVDPSNTDELVGPDLQQKLKQFFNSPYSNAPTFKQLKDQFIFDREIAGNAFAYIIQNVLGTQVLGLQILDPRTMSIVADKHGTIYRYVQSTRSGDTVLFEPHQIVHWKKGQHPDSPLFGQSPMEPVIWEVKTDLSAMVSNYKFFENNSVPASVYIMDETLSDEELIKAVDFMKKNHSGAGNRHKSSALMGVKEIKQTQLSHADIEFLDGRKLSRQKVGGAYGVPEFLLGYTDSVNNNNGVELFRKFIEGTIQDIEDDFESFINEQLFVRLGIQDLVSLDVRKQQVETSAEITKGALEEYTKGAITLRTYKTKTGQEATESDESNPMIDQYIIQQGAGAIILEDVGTQDLTAAKNAEAIQALITQNNV